MVMQTRLPRGWMQADRSADAVDRDSETGNGASLIEITFNAVIGRGWMCSCHTRTKSRKWCQILIMCQQNINQIQESKAVEPGQVEGMASSWKSRHIRPEDVAFKSTIAIPIQSRSQDHRMVSIRLACVDEQLRLLHHLLGIAKTCLDNFGHEVFHFHLFDDKAQVAQQGIVLGFRQRREDPFAAKPSLFEMLYIGWNGTEHQQTPWLQPNKDVADHVLDL